MRGGIRGVVMSGTVGTRGDIRDGIGRGIGEAIKDVSAHAAETMSDDASATMTGMTDKGIVTAGGIIVHAVEIVGTQETSASTHEMIAGERSVVQTEGMTNGDRSAEIVTEGVIRMERTGQGHLTGHVSSAMSELR